MEDNIAYLNSIDNSTSQKNKDSIKLVSKPIPKEMLDGLERLISAAKLSSDILTRGKISYYSAEEFKNVLYCEESYVTFIPKLTKLSLSKLTKVESETNYRIFLPYMVEDMKNNINHICNFITSKIADIYEDLNYIRNNNLHEKITSALSSVLSGKKEILKEILNIDIRVKESNGNYAHVIKNDISSLSEIEKETYSFEILAKFKYIHSLLINLHLKDLYNHLTMYLYPRVNTYVFDNIYSVMDFLTNIDTINYNESILDTYEKTVNEMNTIRDKLISMDLQNIDNDQQLLEAYNELSRLYDVFVKFNDTFYKKKYALSHLYFNHYINSEESNNGFIELDKALTQVCDVYVKDIR